MSRNRLKYLGYGSILGLLVLGLGWGFGNFYLVVLGTMIIAASLTTLTLPRP